MMRLRTPNGLINSKLMRLYADTVEPYGPETGVVDITTRQNIQLRGISLAEADTVIDNLHALNQTSYHSALDNVCACARAPCLPPAPNLQPAGDSHEPPTDSGVKTRRAASHSAGAMCV